MNRKQRSQIQSQATHHMVFYTAGFSKDSFLHSDFTDRKQADRFARDVVAEDEESDVLRITYKQSSVKVFAPKPKRKK